jgi:hypothetical protein
MRTTRETADHLHGHRLESLAQIGRAERAIDLGIQLAENRSTIM